MVKNEIMCDNLINQSSSYFDCAEWNNLKHLEDLEEGLINNQTNDQLLTSRRTFVPEIGVQIIWSCLFGIIVLVSVVGNVTVIWIVAGHRRMRTVTNFFLLSLTISDLISSIFNTAFNFVYMLHNHWIFGQPYCKINNFLANMTVASSVFTITATSFDR